MTLSPTNETPPTPHGRAVRLLHGLNAVAILLLLPSGLEVFNAAPFYAVVFPSWMTLGGGLTGALLWHFAAMWLLVLNGLAYAGVRLLMRRSGPALGPVSPAGVVRDGLAALRGRLAHRSGIYNQVQRALYLGIWLVIALAVLSGLAIWKPVQLRGLTDAIGGYEAGRRIHFWSMAAIGAFLTLHLVMVALVPKSLLAITVGVDVRDDAGGGVDHVRG